MEVVINLKRLGGLYCLESQVGQFQEEDSELKYTVPSSAMWFNINKVHPIEARHFPDFLDSDSNSSFKNKSNYKRIRDSMIRAFQSQPSQYLRVDQIWELKNFDIVSLVRIH